MTHQFHIADLFEMAAAAVPDRTALATDECSFTYRELSDRTSRTAAALFDAGLRRGDHVGIYLANCPEYLETLLAALKIGAVPFNVNYRYRAEELQYLFDNADAIAVVHANEYGPIVDELAATLPKLQHRIVVGGDGKSASTPYESLLAHAPRDDFERGEEDYLLLYTGGTTGMPKGVMWPHREFFFACLAGGGHFHPEGAVARPEEIAGRASGGYELAMLTVAPLMHGAAIWSALSALLGGLKLVLDDAGSFDPERIWTLTERHEVNILQVVGDAMAIPLRDALTANPDRWDLSTLMSFGSGGAVLSAHVKAEIKALIPNVMIVDGMGSSESGIVGEAEPSDEGLMRLPAHETQQVVIDDRLAEVGEVGLVARGGNIPLGYYNDSVKTDETFRIIAGQRWSISGDAGRLDNDGKITVFGRGSTCINTGGEKVFPEEVEEVLRGHPSVLDAVVTSKPDERWGQRVVAVLSARDGESQPDYDTLKNFAKEQLADYKVPREILWAPEVQRSPAGKQDYRWAKNYAESN